MLEKELFSPSRFEWFNIPNQPPSLFKNITPSKDYTTTCQQYLSTIGHLDYHIEIEQRGRKWYVFSLPINWNNITCTSCYYIVTNEYDNWSKFSCLYVCRVLLKYVLLQIYIILLFIKNSKVFNNQWCISDYTGSLGVSAD